MVAQKQDESQSQIEIEAGPVGAEALQVVEPSPMALLERAIDGKVDIEVVERLQEMVYRHQDRLAKQEFIRSLHEFQRECPPIPRNRRASIATRGGGKFGYRFADLEQVVRIVSPILRNVGLSYTWDSEVVDDRITVICTLRHADGHSVDSRFVSPVDTRENRSLSEAQKHGAALSYGKRQSLIAALGLSEGEPDTDGKPYGDEEKDESTITESEARELEVLVSKPGRDATKFLEWVGVKSFKEVPRHRYQEALRLLGVNR